jgi:hypothetical protein
MLGHHTRRRHEFPGSAVLSQTGLGELGELVVGEGVEFATGAFVVNHAVPGRW